MTDLAREPIFTRQEAGVVYLFGRYWDKIDLFSGKRTSRIHTHFPDYTLQDVASGAYEAVEFEYGLNDFLSHVPGDLRKLKKEGIRRLFIVYWDEDTDEGELREEIRKHFKGRLVLVCLRDYFSPCVTPAKDHLDPGWMFAQRGQSPGSVYSFDSIAQDVKRLTAEGNFRRLKPAKGLCRIAGFNRESASFVELDRWKKIHLYLTYRFGEDSIPSRLLVKPRGCHCFSGCFEIGHAFHIAKGSEPVREFFGRYYFFPYERYFKDAYTCLVYSRFRELSHEQGRNLYTCLKKRGYAFRQSSELVDDAHVREIDRIIGRF